MTIPTQLVLQTLLADPERELYGLEIGTAAGLPSGTVHPILARLEAKVGLNRAGKTSTPAAKVDRRGGTTVSPASASTVPRRPSGGPTGPPRRVCGCGRREKRHEAAGPLPTTNRMVELAASTLPAAHRGRYMQEFTAELYGLTHAHQLRHAGGVLSIAWALRAALGKPAPGSMGDTTMRIVQRRPLTCLVLRWHKWKVYSTEDGSNRYNKCLKCGREMWEPYGTGFTSNTFGA